jgi:6-phosphogluconolactonase
MKRIMLLLFVLSLFMSIPFLAQAKGGRGAVYAMTNADDNEIVVYHRAANGMLTMVGNLTTGGSGATTEPGDALGASNPLILSPNHRWLFAVNAGSDEISVFEIDQDGLTLSDVVPSGGDFPVSLTVHHNLLYVLNSGGDGNITGFTFDNNGHLTPLAGSTRSLNAGGTNPPDFLDSPAQVGFNPLGDKLVVTVKRAKTFMDPKIHVFAVDGNGLPSAQPTITMTFVPFGFVFHHLDNLLVAEPFGPNKSAVGDMGAASSYRIAPDGSLVPISESEPNDQTATCWIAITANMRFAYTTNNIPGTISSYKVGADGSLSVISKIAAETGPAPVDLAITPNNQYLYNVNAGNGTVSMFKINQRNGNLIAVR